MIREHCGDRLKYIEGRFTNPSLTYHKWQCVKCTRIFMQKIRLPDPKPKITYDSLCSSKI